MDHRSSKRHTINITADLQCNGAAHQAHVSDISTGGAKIELMASVAWAHGKSLGLKFQDNQNRLDDFLYNLAIYGVAN